MTQEAAVIGGGPAGLMAAEVLSKAGIAVTVYERKPSLGRKFLMAGRGGLNLTHSEPLEAFLARYGAAETRLAPVIKAFPPDALRAWCEGLGQPTFIGSSGRVFPKSFKASPLLRAWQLRLGEQGVLFNMQRSWQGWDATGKLVFTNAHGTTETTSPDATLLALGGASWPRLGSDGAWAKLLEAENVALSPLRPSNCGFAVAWSEIFRQKFAGTPLKPVTLSFNGQQVRGEMMMTQNGIEGGAVYALSSVLREHIAANGNALLSLDLKPGVAEAELAEQLDEPRRGKSLSNFLRKQTGLSPVAISLIQEDQTAKNMNGRDLAALVKAFPLTLTASFSLDRAISSAGGIRFDALDDGYMLKAKPGVFAAGEMLDWEAPTGGYLLQATFSTAVRAAEGILSYLRKKSG